VNPFDTAYSWAAFMVVATVAWLAAALLVQRHPEWGRWTRRLILIAVVLRVIGAAARYEVFFRFYDAGGDAVGYYVVGLTYAKSFWNLDFAIVLDRSLWWVGQWWGSQFLRFVSGAVLTLIGPSMRGEFLVFSLFSLAGLLLFGRAYRRSFPWAPLERYLAWILLLPSLWFWPSSVGKEAFVLLCMGMVAAGHAGDGKKPNWLLMATGLGLAFCVRPHVAAVLIGAVGASQWLAKRQIRGPGDVARTVLVGVLVVVVGVAALERLGVDQVDLEGVQEFMEHRADMTAIGGSAIGSRGGGMSDVPMAFVNILFRPFPWEAHHAFAMLSSLEMVLLWALAFRRRRTLKEALRGWRQNRLLTFALVFSLVYVLMIGLVFHNLGIISRQRVLVFPFLFLILEAQPVPVRRRAPQVAPAPVRRRPQPGRRPPPGPAEIPEGGERPPERLREAGRPGRS
jgi:hypothetical protein